MPTSRHIVPLGTDPRSALPTDEAARHLGLKAHTLRQWACYENGPMKPLRVGNRLRWRTADIRQILGVEAS